MEMVAKTSFFQKAEVSVTVIPENVTEVTINPKNGLDEILIQTPSGERILIAGDELSVKGRKGLPKQGEYVKFDNLKLEGQVLKSDNETNRAARNAMVGTVTVIPMAIGGIAGVITKNPQMIVNGVSAGIMAGFGSMGAVILAKSLKETPKAAPGRSAPAKPVEHTPPLNPAPAPRQTTPVSYQEQYYKRKIQQENARMVGEAAGAAVGAGFRILDSVLR